MAALAAFGSGSPWRWRMSQPPAKYGVRPGERAPLDVVAAGVERLQGEAVGRARHQALLEVGALEHLLDRARAMPPARAARIRGPGHDSGRIGGHIGVGHLCRLSALNERACSPPYW